jgi:hypothetical protein
MAIHSLTVRCGVLEWGVRGKVVCLFVRRLFIKSLVVVFSYRTCLYTFVHSFIHHPLLSCSRVFHPHPAHPAHPAHPDSLDPNV